MKLGLKIMIALCFGFFLIRAEAQFMGSAQFAGALGVSGGNMYGTGAYGANAPCGYGMAPAGFQSTQNLDPDQQDMQDAKDDIKDKKQEKRDKERDKRDYESDMRRAADRTRQLADPNYANDLEAIAKCEAERILGAGFDGEIAFNEAQPENMSRIPASEESERTPASDDDGASKRPSRSPSAKAAASASPTATLAPDGKDSSAW